MPWKKIAATIGIAESAAIYLYGINPTRLRSLMTSAESSG